MKNFFALSLFISIFTFNGVALAQDVYQLSVNSGDFLEDSSITISNCSDVTPTYVFACDGDRPLVMLFRRDEQDGLGAEYLPDVTAVFLAKIIDDEVIAFAVRDIAGYLRIYKKLGNSFTEAGDAEIDGMNLSDTNAVRTWLEDNYN